MAEESPCAEAHETMVGEEAVPSNQAGLDEENKAVVEEVTTKPAKELKQDPSRIRNVWRLLFPQKNEIIGDTATTSIISASVSLLFEILWIVAIPLAVLMAIAGVSLLTGDLLWWQKTLAAILDLLFIAIVLFSGRIFWRAGKEIEKSDDKHYVVAVFASMMAAGAVLIAIITLFVTIALQLS